MTKIEASIAEVLYEWYDACPEVSRAAVYESLHASESGAGVDVAVFVELLPTMDDDDVTPIWLAHASRWRRVLQSRITRTVGVFLAGPESITALSADGPFGEPVCVADHRSPL